MCLSWCGWCPRSSAARSARDARWVVLTKTRAITLLGLCSVCQVHLTRVQGCSVRSCYATRGTHDCCSAPATFTEIHRWNDHRWNDHSTRAHVYTSMPYHMDARVCRVGVWFGFVRSALLLAVVASWVDCCFDSCQWVLLGLLCFLRVTHGCMIFIAMLVSFVCKAGSVTGIPQPRIQRMYMDANHRGCFSLRLSYEHPGR